ncbi:hypothetical protein MMC07_002625 [Pseudocyphellaria aurata]|nr:hypothetical protein [Pseudocyphellaria aurata]
MSILLKIYLSMHATASTCVQEAHQLQGQIEAVRMDSRLSDDAREAQLRPLHTKLYILAGKAKVDAAAKLALSSTEAGKKVLIFGHHQEVLDGLQARLSREGVGFVRIDGSTEGVRRSAAAKQFQTDDNIMVALLSITAAGQGLTLTAAAAVIMAELVFTPGELIQAEDRAHRIGQTRGLFVYYLLALDTNDDIMWRNVKGKLHGVGQTMDGHVYGTAVEQLSCCTRPGYQSGCRVRNTAIICSTFKHRQLQQAFSALPSASGISLLNRIQANGSQPHRGTGVFAEVSDDVEDNADAEEALLASVSPSAAMHGGRWQQQQQTQPHFVGTPVTLDLNSQPDPLAHPATPPTSSQGRIPPAEVQQPDSSAPELPDAQQATQPVEQAVHEFEEQQPEGAAKRRRSLSGPVVDLSQGADGSHPGSQAQQRRRLSFHQPSQGISPAWACQQLSMSCKQGPGLLVTHAPLQGWPRHEHFIKSAAGTPANPPVIEIE